MFNKRSKLYRFDDAWKERGMCYISKSSFQRDRYLSIVFQIFSFSSRNGRHEAFEESRDGSRSRVDAARASAQSRLQSFDRRGNEVDSAFNLRVHRLLVRQRLQRGKPAKARATRLQVGWSLFLSFFFLLFPLPPLSSFISFQFPLLPFQWVTS